MAKNLMSDFDQERPSVELDEELFSLGDDVHDSVPSAVRRASNTLRREILMQEESGQFLGSEEELVSRLEVSRPTFRQVARLLEQEQLLTIRKGPGGGFFSRKPTFGSIVHQASICLIAHKFKRDQLTCVSQLLCIEAARLAASNPSIEERERLQRFLENSELQVEVTKRRHWLGHIWQFSLQMLEIASNPVLTMFLHISMEFAAASGAGKQVSKEHVAEYLQNQQKLASAIAEGDVDYTKLLAHRLYGAMFDRTLGNQGDG